MVLSLVALCLLRQTVASPVVQTLPPPLPLPTGEGVDPADVLAEKVARHAPDAPAALITALQECGFTIVDHNRKVLYAPNKEANNGISIEDREVMTVLNATPDSPDIAFKSISDALSVLTPGTGAPVIHQKILDAWQRGLGSSNPGVRFYCRFLDELSEHGEGAWSINGSGFAMGNVLQGSNPSPLGRTPLAAQGPVGLAGSMSSWVNGAMQHFAAQMQRPNMTTQQRMTVMERLVPLQELQASLVQNVTAPMLTDSTSQDGRPFGDKPLSPVQTLLLSRRIYADTFIAAYKPESNMLASTGPAIDDRDYTGNIIDAGAVGVSTLFNQLIFTEENVGNLAKAADVVNTAAAWGKIVATFANLKIKLDPHKVELNRRKDKKPGEPKTLGLNVSIDMPSTDGGGKTGGLMLRGMSWGAGADVSLPDHGGVAGAEVNWHLTEAGSILDKACQWMSPGQAGDGQIKTVAQTDSAGNVKIGIQASAQREELPANSVSYVRWATIRTEVRLKGANLYQDTVDIMQQVVGAGTGGLIGFFKSGLPDMLNRTTFLSTQEFPVKINDWTPPVYEGTFTLTVTGQAHKTVGDDSMQWNVDRHASGKLYSLARGFSKAEMLAKEGRGGYFFDLEKLGNASVKDSYVHKYLTGDCVDKGIPATDTFECHGPVAALDYPYALQGGALIIKSEHTNGKDQTSVVGGTGFSLPCKYKLITPNTKDSGVEYMNIPIEFKDTLPARPTSLNGSGIQKTRITIGGLEGEIQAKLVWELHPVKP